ncbi:DUF3784 domain-containing protein [Neobacillus sp. Marseille-QA0830]
MWVLVIVQVGMILLFGILAWAILKKKAYSLLSGFALRPKEEQQKLIENGLPQRTGKLMLVTAVGMLILLPLVFTSFKYVIEIQFGYMVLVLLGGFIYISRYDVPRKRKQSYLISTSLFVAVMALIGVIMYQGYKDYQLTLQKQTFEITGPYGDKWSYQDVKQVELLDKMPEVTYRQNGFGVSTMLKGKFKVENYGNALLFIRKNSPPYIYIETSKQNLFINAKTPEQTEQWFADLKDKVE